jgi:hypothetical protein
MSEQPSAQRGKQRVVTEDAPLPDTSKRCVIPVADQAALDVIADILRDPEWAVGMLEDIAEIVTTTGRNLENPSGSSTWERH